MPDGDEGEDQDVGADGAGGGGPAGREARPAQGDVDVAQRPAVEAAVPAAPERQRAVVVGDAAHHVLGRVDAVGEGPEPEEPPRQQQLEPDDVQVEEAHRAQLRPRVRAPVRAPLGHRLHVAEVQRELHGEEAPQEPQPVAHRPRRLDAGRPVPPLRDVVVEGEDWPRQVQGCVDGVGDVVPERVVARLRGDSDPIALAERRGV